MRKWFSWSKRFLCGTWQGLLQPFQQIWQHRELVTTLIRRDFRIRTSGSVLGVFWMLLQPALQIIGFWFLLEIVLKAKYPGRVPFLDYFLVGMLVWMLVSDSLGRSVTVFRDMSALFQRSLFPIGILPLLPLLSNMVLYPAIFFVVLLILEGFQSALLGVSLFFFIIIWLIPLCYLLAVMGLFVRDLTHLIPFLITITMYATPILYMPEMLPPIAQQFMLFNPFADLMAVVHGTTQGMPMNLGHGLRLFVIWLCLLAPAWLLFQRVKMHIREVL